MLYTLSQEQDSAINEECRTSWDAVVDFYIKVHGRFAQDVMSWRASADLLSMLEPGTPLLVFSTLSTRGSLAHSNLVLFFLYIINALRSCI